MKSDKKTLLDARLFLFIPMLVMMVVIFIFSNDQGEESSSLSLEVSREIVESVDDIVYDNTLSERSVQQMINKIHLPVRKLAHMCEYALLALFAFIPLLFYEIKLTRYNYIIPLVISFFYACTDEFHQQFINERSGNFKDVMIDTSGSILMLLFIFICIKIYNIFVRKKKKPVV